MLQTSCAKCCVELQCKKNGVYLIHFIDSDPEKGIDVVRSGDLWECPICGCEVVTGLAKEEMLGFNLNQEFIKFIMDNYQNSDKIVVVNRG